MSRKSLLEITLSTSARVGSLLIPAASLESHLGRFAHNLMIWTHDDAFKLRLLGSSVGLIHSGRVFLLCSKHQLRDCELKDVGLLVEEGGNLVTSSGSRTFTDAKYTLESDAYDVAAFDFYEPSSEHPELLKRFFKFQQIPADTTNTNILAFVVAGYPSKEQLYDLEENNHLGLARRVLVAEPDSQPSDPALLKLKFSQSLDFDPDGLSGGPAFVIQFLEGEPCVFFAGIILRSGKSHCYILKSGFLWSFLNSFV